MTENKSTFHEYVYPVIILTAIAFVVTFLLAMTNNASAPVIAANAIASANATRQELLPAADGFTETALTQSVTSSDGKAEVVGYYVADNGAGVVETIETTSFGGKLTMMVGIDADGAITGVKVTDHADTPGVGTKDQAPEYLAQYQGLSELTNENVKKEAAVTTSGAPFAYITGASVSGTAIHKGVGVALNAFGQLGLGGAQ